MADKIKTSVSSIVAARMPDPAIVEIDLALEGSKWLTLRLSVFQAQDLLRKVAAVAGRG